MSVVFIVPTGRMLKSAQKQ